MKDTDEPLRVRAAALRVAGLKVADPEPGGDDLHVVVPGYEACPLTVSGAGEVLIDCYNPRCTEPRLRRRQQVLMACQELVSDLYGLESVSELTEILVDNGFDAHYDHGEVSVAIGNPASPVEIRIQAGEARAFMDGTPLPEEELCESARDLQLIRGIAGAANGVRLRRTDLTIADYLDEDDDRGNRVRTDGGDWHTLFSRSRGKDKFFYIKGSTSDLIEAEGYYGGHDVLNDVLDLCARFGFEPRESGSSSPGSNVASYEYHYAFLDGGVHIYGGNYFGSAPGQGAWIEGCLALRWVLWHIGCRPPRRLKGEVAAPSWVELAELAFLPHKEVWGSWRRPTK